MGKEENVLSCAEHEIKNVVTDIHLVIGYKNIESQAPLVKILEGHRPPPVPTTMCNINIIVLQLTIYILRSDLI